jgi:hypothetical protein
LNFSPIKILDMHLIKMTAIFSSLVLSVSISAQSFKKGFVISPEGDTLHGLVREGSAESLSFSIDFKASRHAAVQHFSAEQIRAFGFQEGDYFESHFVHFTVKSKDGWQAQSGQRFLYRLVEGPLNLYELQDGQEMPLFIKKNGQALQLLCFDKEGQPEYRQVLQMAVADCPQLVFPEKIKLEAYAVQALVEHYNDCGRPDKGQQVPSMQVWGFGSLSAIHLIERYKGFGKGLSAEIRPFNTGFRSRWTIGIDYENAIYESFSGRYLYQIKLNSLAIKTRFFLPTRSPHIVPYGFLGGKMTWGESTTYWDRDTENNSYTDSYHQLKLQLGVGLQAQFGRHFFRLEAPFDNSANFRLGYGVALWK